MTTKGFTPEEVADVLADKAGDELLSRKAAFEQSLDEPSYAKADLALMRNDLRGLTRGQVADVVARLCERMGVDPALAPIDVIPTREGKLIPYINARGAAELRKRHGLEVRAIEVVKERPGLVVLRAVLRDRDGRSDMAIGAAEWREDRPQDEARAWMVAETRAKRRATMSAVGIFLEGPSEEVEGEPG